MVYWHISVLYDYMDGLILQESFDFGGINWDECGRTEGCFLYPRLCDGSDCKAAVTYKPVGDSFVLQLFVAGASYISVGFSDDKEMVSCVVSSLN